MHRWRKPDKRHEKKDWVKEEMRSGAGKTGKRGRIKRTCSLGEQEGRRNEKRIDEWSFRLDVWLAFSWLHWTLLPHRSVRFHRVQNPLIPSEILLPPGGSEEIRFFTPLWKRIRSEIQKQFDDERLDWRNEAQSSGGSFCSGSWRSNAASSYRLLIQRILKERLDSG